VENESADAISAAVINVRFKVASSVAAKRANFETEASFRERACF
jgi:hypothetical protein